MNRKLVWAAAPLLPLLACSSSTGAGGPDNNQANDGAVGPQTDGAGGVSTSSSGGGVVPEGGGSSGSSSSGGSSSGGSTMDAGAGSAGKAGVDAFCTQITGHEQSCAAALDASAASLSGFTASCESMNEAAGANPPTELYRADYLAALGACIASSSCSVALQSAETSCGSSVTVAPTQALTAFCHSLTTSPCGPDSGAQNCAGAFLIYSDTALDAAAACFSSTNCTQVDSCYSAAFNQP